MISRIEFINKDEFKPNDYTVPVAAIYNDIYNYEPVEFKFNSDFDWFATSPSLLSFELKYDQWIQDNIFDKSNDIVGKYCNKVVRAYDDDVIFFEGIMLIEDCVIDRNNLMVSFKVNDWLILYKDMDNIDFDLSNATTSVVSQNLLNEPFLHKYGQDVSGLLNILKSVAEQTYFNPDQCNAEFLIEKDAYIKTQHGQNKIITDNKTWLWAYFIFNLIITKNDVDNGWYDVQIRVFNLDTNTEVFGGDTALAWTSIYGWANVETEVKSRLMKSAMVDTTWNANFSYNTTSYELYRMVFIERPTTDFNEVRVYKSYSTIVNSGAPVKLLSNINFTEKQQAQIDTYLVGFFHYADTYTASTFFQYNSGSRGDTLCYTSFYYEVIDDYYVFYFTRISNTIGNPASTNEFTFHQDQYWFLGYAYDETLSKKNINIDLNGGGLNIQEMLTDYRGNIIAAGGDPDKCYTGGTVANNMIANEDYFFYSGTPAYHNASEVREIKTTIDNSTYTARLDRIGNSADDQRIELTIAFNGYTANPILNYKEPINSDDILQLITRIDNCSYFFTLSQFNVLDKIALSANKIIDIDDVIGLKDERILNAKIDESIYDKLLLYDAVLFKQYVEDYYNAYWDSVKYRKTFELSNIFTSYNIKLGDAVSYDGNDWIVSNVKKINDKIDSVIMFNSSATFLEFSNNGTTKISAELSNNGTDLLTWNIRSV